MKKVILPLIFTSTFSVSTMAMDDTRKDSSLLFGVGYYYISDFCDGASDFGFSCEDSNVNFMAGVEGKLTDFLSLSFLGSYYLPVDVDNGSLEVSTDKLILSAQLGGHVYSGNSLEFYSKVGMAFWRTELSATYYGDKGSVTESDFDPVVTFGVSFKTQGASSVGLQLDHYPDLGNDEVGETDFTSVALLFKF